MNQKINETIRVGYVLIYILAGHSPHNVARLLLGQRHHRGQIVEQLALPAQLEHQENKRIGLEHVLQLNCFFENQTKKRINVDRQDVSTGT